MSELRGDQVDRLARHSEQALTDLLLASAVYQGSTRLRETPEGRALLAERPDRLVSIAVSAAGAALERRRALQEDAEAKAIVRLDPADAFAFEVIDALKRRKLPYEPADAELILDLGATTMDPDRVFLRCFEVLALGIAAASSVLRASPGSPPVIGALERAGAAIDALGLVHTSDPGKLRRRMRALVAEHVPGGLLDLSVVDPHDHWAALASEALRRHASSAGGTQELLALLSSAKGTRPTQTWRRTSAALVRGDPSTGALLRELLEPLLEIGLSPSGVPWPPVWLLAPQNEVLARGATWALTDVDEPWVAQLLGRLALRCAAPTPHPTVTTALSLATASGAVEALAAIGTPPAHDELRMLLGEIRRRDLLKRIAAIVGEEADLTGARDDRVRREKQRVVQRKANPEPKQRQRDASAYVRRELAPVLRSAGFADSAGRTFWRHLDDRIETLHCKAHTGGLTLELGIYLRFVPHWYRVPERDGALRPAEHHCDVRGRVHPYDDLAAAASEAERWFARWRPLAAVLGWLRAGTMTGEELWCGAPGSPQRALLTGYVARELGDTDLARGQLTHAASSFREMLDERRATRPRDVTPEWAAWVEQLEADASG